jgi:plastin-3
LFLSVERVKRQVHFQVGLFNQISLEQCPGLANLLSNGEKIEDLMKLSPGNLHSLQIFLNCPSLICHALNIISTFSEATLLRWVNYQLERAGVQKRVNNFTNDISDSEAYTHLLYQVLIIKLLNFHSKFYK